MPTKQAKPSGAVHPVAALFPMMTEEELDDLAADIQANGQLQPIILDAEGQLIDGRNRLEGCRRAGVEPKFGTLNGHDAVAFILSSNSHRRHLNSTQKYLSIAMGMEASGFKPDTRTFAKQAGVRDDTLGVARIVLKEARDLAMSCMAGTLSLRDAYDQLRERRAAAESEEAQFARLQESDPELALKVQEGELTLQGAIFEAGERRRMAREAVEREKSRLRAVAQNFDSALMLLDVGKDNGIARAESWLDADPAYVKDVDFSAERVRRVAAALNYYADRKDERDAGS